MSTAINATPTEKKIKEHLVQSVELLFTGSGNGGRSFVRDLTKDQYVRIQKCTGIDFSALIAIREKQ
jgi:ribosomal protein S11